MRTGDRARRGESTRERDGRVDLRRKPRPIRRKVPVGWGHKWRHVVGRPELLRQAQNCQCCSHMHRRNRATCCDVKRRNATT